MKCNMRLVFLAALAAILTVELAPLLGSPSNGGAFAQTTPPPADFTLSNPKLQVTYETENSTSCNPSPTVVSCAEGTESDSYELTASLDASKAVDLLDTDLTTNGLDVLLVANNCANLVNPTTGALTITSSILDQVIPGNAVHVTTNKHGAIYSFDGNVPEQTPGAICFSNCPPVPYDHLEMNLKIDGSGEGELHIQANADMCGISGTPLTGSSPVAMIFDAGYFNGNPSNAGEPPDADFSCVDVTPQVSTVDISSICGKGE